MISLVRWCSVRAERVSSTSCGSSSTSRILPGLAITSPLDQYKRKAKGRNTTHAALCPSASSVPLNDTLDVSLPNSQYGDTMAYQQQTRYVRHSNSASRLTMQARFSAKFRAHTSLLVVARFCQV